jgi:hypothetical protein
VEDAQATVISTTMNGEPKTPAQSALELARKINGKKEEAQQDVNAKVAEPDKPADGMQPNLGFEESAQA